MPVLPPAGTVPVCTGCTGLYPVPMGLTGFPMPPTGNPCRANPLASAIMADAINVVLTISKMTVIFIGFSMPTSIPGG
ncbi:MAG: hypothetical protein WBZ29_03140 [Methanocella sp.]